MLKQKQRITHLMDELLHYMLESEPEKVIITIEDLSDRVQMSIDQVGMPCSEQECRRVERLLNAEGTSRRDLGREKFVERVWQWKEESGGKIAKQTRRLGASVDWTRDRFTMDEGCSAAVRSRSRIMRTTRRARGTRTRTVTAGSS